MQRIIERRQRLHDLYAEHSGLIDASRLAHLNGTRIQIDSKSLQELWSQASISYGDTEAWNHVYVHVPFCKSICSFCNYERLRPSSTKELENYVAQIVQQIQMLGDSVRHLEFSSIYFGGGTPSVLSPMFLETIMQTLEDSLQFHPQNSRHFEFDPAIMNAEKLQVLQKYGFQRLSFGVQSLDTSVNQNHNRGPQSRKILEKRFLELKEAQIDDVACDILLGLAGTTPRQMLDEISEILQKHRPNRIDIFMITPTQDYVDGHFSSSFELFWSHLQQFELDVLPLIPEIAEKNGYKLKTGVGHRMTLQRKQNKQMPPRVIRSYNPLSHQQGAPVNVLAFGPSARGSIFNTLQYENMRQGDDWFVEGYRIQNYDEARIHLCYELRDKNIIDQQKFQLLHHMSFEQRFPLAHHVWTQEGLWNQETHSLQDQTRLERTKSLMWLVEEERIEDEIARHLQFDLTKSGILGHISPFQEGSIVDPNLNVVIHQIDVKRIVLKKENQTFAFRVAPGWGKEDAFRCIALDTIPIHLKDAIRRIVSILRKMSQRYRRTLS